MASSALCKLTCVIFAFIVMASPYAEAIIPISCNLVDAKIEPCRTYLVIGGMPTTTCCNGVRALSILATPGRISPDCVVSVLVSISAPLLTALMSNS
ncbi:hypothetical protein Ancab_016678, partial [Ancistrocladus abbreviatus]